MKQSKKFDDENLSIIYCPKCGIKLIDNCCIKCGYLLNGNAISKKDIIREKKDIEKIEDYDIILHNENWKIPLIIGPLYLSYKRNLLLGTIMLFTDILMFIAVGLISASIPIVCFFVPLWLLIYLIINRINYSFFSNIIFLKLTELKLIKLKKKYPENYIEKLNQSNSVLFVILILIIVATFFGIIIINRRIQNGTMTNLFF